MRRRSIVRERTQREEVIIHEGQVEKADADADGQGQKTLKCPTCGKALAARGAHFHIRACKG